MSGPQNINPRPLAAGSLEELEQRFAGIGWEFYEQQFKPATVADGFNPEDGIKRFAAAMSQTPQGRAFVDYLLDLTCRAPYPVTTQSMEDLAFAAAKHQARAAVGETLVKVICEGRKLNEKS